MRTSGLIGLSLLAIAGCAPKATVPVTAAAPPAAAQAQAQAQAQGRIVGTLTAGGKFAKLRIGMSSKQVTDLIGPPTTTDAHITGKAFIPFYFGGDTSRSQAFYRGEGQLTYSAGRFAGVPDPLVTVRVNTAETGQPH